MNEQQQTNLTEQYRKRIDAAMMVADQKQVKNTRSLNTTNVLATLALAFCGFLAGSLLFSSLLISAVTFYELAAYGSTYNDSLMGAMVCAITSIPFVLGFISSLRTKRRIKRFKRYQTVIGGRRLCPVSVLAKSTRQNHYDTASDVQKMIDKGYFSEAFLDDDRECLMLDRETYRRYLYNSSLVDQKSQETQEIESVLEQPAKPGESELGRMLAEGKKCLMDMKDTVLWWRGGEAKERLAHIEQTTLKIFDCVTNTPDKAEETRKLMNYYLPTMVKLLKSYDRLDAQKVEGENISSAKREIENILATIETAFEKLLDSLFEDDALDVSTDITVLATMLSQEGLTESELYGSSGYSAAQSSVISDKPLSSLSEFFTEERKEPAAEPISAVKRDLDSDSPPSIKLEL